jgi:hypothetical protein
VLNLLQALPDDQTALLGCAGALLVAGAMMYVSYFVGPARRRELQAGQSLLPTAPQPIRRAEDRAA